METLRLKKSPGGRETVPQKPPGLGNARSVKGRSATERTLCPRSAALKESLLGGARFIDDARRLRERSALSGGAPRPPSATAQIAPPRKAPICSANLTAKFNRSLGQEVACRSPGLSATWRTARSVHFPKSRDVRPRRSGGPRGARVFCDSPCLGPRAGPVLRKNGRRFAFGARPSLPPLRFGRRTTKCLNLSLFCDSICTSCRFCPSEPHHCELSQFAMFRHL
jgi:hypothetical protein